MKHPSQEIDNEARADDYLRNRDFKGKSGTYTTLEVRQLMCGFAKKEVQRAQSRVNRDKGSDRNHGNAHGRKGPTARQTQKAQETISALGFAMNLIVSVDKQTAPYGLGFPWVKTCLMRLGSLYTALTTENGSCDALVIWREGRLKGRPPQQFDDQQEAWVATAAAYALTAAGLDPAEATERVSAIAANVGGFEIKPEKIRAKLSGLSASTRKDLDALHKGRPIAEVEDKVRRSLAWMSLASAEALTDAQ